MQSFNSLQNITWFDKLRPDMKSVLNQISIKTLRFQHKTLPRYRFRNFFDFFDLLRTFKLTVCQLNMYSIVVVVTLVVLELLKPENNCGCFAFITKRAMPTCTCMVALKSQKCRVGVAELVVTGIADHVKRTEAFVGIVRLGARSSVKVVRHVRKAWPIGVMSRMGGNF